jgi:hypothetical protein
MKRPIVGEPMKQRWHIRRTIIPLAQGQQRWEQAYQLLLRWAMMKEQALSMPTSLPQEEVSYVSSHVPTRIDHEPGSASDLVGDHWSPPSHSPTALMEESRPPRAWSWLSFLGRPPPRGGGVKAERAPAGMIHVSLGHQLPFVREGKAHHG